jgi:hypothetical protein
MVFDGKHRYAEILCFFIVHKGDLQHTLQIFGLSDLHLLKESYKTLHVCKFPGEEDVIVVDVKSITDIVKMVSFSQHTQEREDLNQREYSGLKNYCNVWRFCGGGVWHLGAWEWCLVLVGLGKVFFLSYRTSF